MSSSSQRLQVIPLGNMFLLSVIFQIIIIPKIAQFCPEVDVFGFFIYSIPGIISLVWSIIYIGAFFVGYGLTNTPTSPKSISLKNLELVKPKYATNFEKTLLLMVSFVLLSICLLSYLLAFSSLYL